MHQQHNHKAGGGNWWRSNAAKLALYVFLAVIAFLLITEHWAHILGLPPLFLILGLCIAMHLFMHGGGHGGHGGGNDQSEGGHAGHGGARSNTLRD